MVAEEPIPLFERLYGVKAQQAEHKRLLEAAKMGLEGYSEKFDINVIKAQNSVLGLEHAEATGGDSLVNRDDAHLKDGFATSQQKWKKEQNDGLISLPIGELKRRMRDAGLSYGGFTEKIQFVEALRGAYSFFPEERASGQAATNSMDAAVEAKKRKFIEKDLLSALDESLEKEMVFGSATASAANPQPDEKPEMGKDPRYMYDAPPTAAEGAAGGRTLQSLRGASLNTTNYIGHGYMKGRLAGKTYNDQASERAMKASKSAAKHLTNVARSAQVDGSMNRRERQEALQHMAEGLHAAEEAKRVFQQGPAPKPPSHTAGSASGGTWI